MQSVPPGSDQVFHSVTNGTAQITNPSLRAVAKQSLHRQIEDAFRAVIKKLRFLTAKFRDGFVPSHDGRRVFRFVPKKCFKKRERNKML